MEVEYNFFVLKGTVSSIKCTWITLSVSSHLLLMAIKRVLKILDKHHLRQYQQHQRSSLYIGFIEIDRRQFIFHFEARFCAKFIFCRWRHLGQEALGCSDTWDDCDVEGDGYYDCYKDLLFIMLIIYCIPSTVALSGQVITTAVVAMLACGVLAPDMSISWPWMSETQPLFHIEVVTRITKVIYVDHNDNDPYEHHHNLEKQPQMPV